jgi:membrane-bound serine protease (ClpP class)
VPVLTYLPAGGVDAMALRLAGSSALPGSAPAPDLGTLLQGADGRTVQTAAGVVQLGTAGAELETVEMEPLELLVHRLLDPTTAYLLFVLGLYAVFVELSHPGALVPGLTGLASLIVAVGAFALLAVNPLGVLLILLAVGLMALDVRALGHGALTLLGAGCLVVGSLLLYSHWGGGSPPDVSIAPAALVVVTGAGLALGLGLLRIARDVRQLPGSATFGTDHLIGARGVARGGLAPEGVVQVNGQLWSARVRSGRLEAGQAVRVRARHGLVLDVEPAVSLGAATQKGALR